MPSPDYKMSLDFLEKWSNGSWVLTAISLDKKSITTNTFHKREDAQAFIEQYGKDRNIYFSVNPNKHDMNKKPAREDVLSMDWLHVDIDPRVGEDVQQEQERALRLLNNPPNGIPKPTVVVFSGGGYQGYWKLMEPVEIDGEAARYEEAKRYNQALELAFGADNCHNVDRIMRLPGTINRPDAKKVKKGRVEAKSELVSWDKSLIYPISDFKPAAAVQSEKTGFGRTNRVQVSGNVKRLDDVNDLPERVSNLCKIVIVQGHDPENPTRFPSRSEALFYVCCELVRGEVDDDTIFAILTDPDFGISSSVLDKGRNAESYAIRQIEQAREYAIDPMLREMNEKHAVVVIGGDPKVIYERYDSSVKRHKLVRMSFSAFQNKFRNRRVNIGEDAQGNPRSVPLGKWWLDHEDRREYEGVVFAPNQETPEDYNMWRGYAMEPTAGDKHELYLTHIKENICSGEDNLYQYVLGWMARAVQLPGEPGHAAIVLRGDQGVGKGFFVNTLGKLFGRHYLAVSNAQHLTGNFNAHLRDCVILFADEAFYAGDKRHASVLKTLVTEPEIMIEAKGVDSETSNNCLHLIMASNEDWVVPAGLNERRFCVLDVGSKHMQDAGYFGRIAESLKVGGYANLLHFLLNYDLSGYNVRDLPQTAALRDQKVQSFDGFQEWWYGKLRDGKLLDEHDKWQDEVYVEELKNDYFDQMRQQNTSRRGTSTKLNNFLERACPGLARRQGRDSITIGDKTIQRPYFYAMPSLSVLREHWDKSYGGPYDWPEAEESKKIEEPQELPF